MSILSKRASVRFPVGSTLKNLLKLGKEQVDTDIIMSYKEVLNDIMGEGNDKDEIATNMHNSLVPDLPKYNELLRTIETISNYFPFIGNGIEV